MGGRVEWVKGKGCSKLFVEISSSFRVRGGLQSMFEEPMSPASSSFSVVQSSRPFSGLVICVTGLSKGITDAVVRHPLRAAAFPKSPCFLEARKQVMDATERLGGQYSPNLHPKSTHLVVQSFHGRKFEHALKHGSSSGLFVVALGWFVDSVRRDVRLSESLYSVKNVREDGTHKEDLNGLVHFVSAENSCIPVGMHENAKQSQIIEEPPVRISEKVAKRSAESTLSGHSLYVDQDVSRELRSKVTEAAKGEGASFADQWLVGCSTSHVVCEGPSIRKYLGHVSNVVTPLWVLKTTKEKRLQRLVHISADLAQQVGIMLDNVQNGIYGEVVNTGGGLQDDPSYRRAASHEERQNIVSIAKNGVRKRRGHRMQTCQTPIRPLTPSSLLDSICWSISEPTSTAAIYTDSFSIEDASEHNTSVFYDVNGDEKESEASFVNLSRPLRESEKMELIFKNHFLTILFPVDRFAEMGPSSRTFFSDTGFTCLQLLDHIYAFYQENMSSQEIEVAIHTDSRHADRLRSVYSSRETAEQGRVAFKRIDFLGSRRSFEMLKRVSGDNNSNVYELLIRA